MTVYVFADFIWGQSFPGFMYFVSSPKYAELWECFGDGGQQVRIKNIVWTYRRFSFCERSRHRPTLENQVHENFFCIIFLSPWAICFFTSKLPITFGMSRKMCCQELSSTFARFSSSSFVFFLGRYARLCLVPQPPRPKVGTAHCGRRPRPRTFDSSSWSIANSRRPPPRVPRISPAIPRAASRRVCIKKPS